MRGEGRGGERRGGERKGREGRGILPLPQLPGYATDYGGL